MNKKAKIILDVNASLPEVHEVENVEFHHKIKFVAFKESDLLENLSSESLVQLGKLKREEWEGIIFKNYSSILYCKE
jgi:hypothetical protein